MGASICRNCGTRMKGTVMGEVVEYNGYMWSSDRVECPNCDNAYNRLAGVPIRPLDEHERRGVDRHGAEWIGVVTH